MSESIHNAAALAAADVVAASGDDAALARLAAQGDQDAFARIMRRYNQRNLLRSYLSENIDATVPQTFPFLARAATASSSECSRDSGWSQAKA